MNMWDRSNGGRELLGVLWVMADKIGNIQLQIDVGFGSLGCRNTLLSAACPPPFCLRVCSVCNQANF